MTPEQLAAIEALGAKAAEDAPPLNEEQQAVLRRVFAAPAAEPKSA
jgi:hypothetical protein